MDVKGLLKAVGEDGFLKYVSIEHCLTSRRTVMHCVVSTRADSFCERT